MLFKEDMDVAKQHMDAWWDRESFERPAIRYTYPKEVRVGGSDHWHLAKHPDGIDDALDASELDFAATFYGAEDIPRFNVNYGPGIMACVLGATLEFKSQTAWFSRPTALSDIVPVLESAEMNMNNPWYERLVRVTSVAARRAKGAYQVGMTDLGGVLDILASFLSPRDIFYAMRKKPGIIDACRAIILEKWEKVYNALQAATEAGSGVRGCSAWMNVWCRKHWYPLQCDFAYMLSPALFKRFVLPDIVTQTEHLDYAIYHLDGVGQLPFLDDLLAVPRLTGIQWVPGDGKPPMGDDTWMPVYRKIQAAGKNIEAGTSPELTVKMYHELDGNGLLVGTRYPGKIWADFYLPEFMGGCAGRDED